MAEDDELKRLQAQAKEDRKLIRKAADTLAEIGRNDGLSDEHADVLTALRIRLEGKKRASLDELLTVTKDIAGKKDLGDVLSGGDEKSVGGWPVVEEKKKEWPGA
ncbi:MAG: hypothetical protein M3P01_08340 [Actinomycetota bacterium]|nr:hypothetical protein [Actinomycetota bacterium]